MTEADGRRPLVLAPQSLLSKWGFNDGDMPDDVADAWDELHPDRFVSVAWRDGVLPQLVREFLEPALDQDVTLTEIGTNHNPIRASTVNGIDVEEFWVGPHRDDEPRLTPETVEVPMAEVLRLCEVHARPA